MSETTDAIAVANIIMIAANERNITPYSNAINMLFPASPSSASCPSLEWAFYTLTFFAARA
jgi:hypothetical protein